MRHGTAAAGICPFDRTSDEGITSLYSFMRRLFLIFTIFGGTALSLSAQYQDSFKVTWIEPGSGAILPEFDAFDSVDGTLGVLNASGPVNTDGHPFFTALGTNGRACVNCHQPTYGMSVSTAGLLDRWRSTDGKDPVFAAFDGSNCPGLPQDQESSHSLLLKRGLFRIPLAWPPKQRGRLAETGGVHDRSGARPHDMQHQPGIRSQERRADHFRVPPPAPGGESEIRYFRRPADRSQDRDAGRRRS